MKWIATDSGSGIAKVQISPNGKTWVDATGTNSFVWCGLTNGYHTFYVKATDNAGNAKVTSVTFYVHISGGYYHR
jgi:hypothetical protein